ncbi:MAG: tetratricopeptide repeat protein [Bacteroidia bacterium]|nr:tetratricopeptide repeat protein [Bacteroidia bacterium]
MRFLLVFNVLILPVVVFSQGVNHARADSLERRLQEYKTNDTARVLTLINLANVFLNFSATPEEKQKAYEYGNRALQAADSTGNKPGLVGVYSFFGQYYQILGNLPKALENNLRALKLAEETGRWSDILRIKNSIGALYFSMEDNKNALRFYQEVLQLAQEKNRSPQIAQAQSNIGIIHHRLKEYGKALDFYTQALFTCEKSNYQKVKGHVLNSLGRLYFDMALDDQDNQTSNLFSQSMDKAIHYYDQSLKIKREQNDIRGIANTLGNLATAYKERGQFENALNYYIEGMQLAEQTHYYDWLKEGYGGMYELYERTGDYKNALKYYIKYKKITDSLLNANAKEEMAELQGKYNTEKKDREIELYKKEQDLSNAKLSQQRMLIWFSGAGLLIVIVFSFFLFRGFKEKQKINAIIEEKNKSITDSILYARRIQTAILPSDEVLHAGLGEHFVYYRPKDIVSGDFYFFSSAGSKVIFAVADCTGHGVPGAFMSMIGNSLLSEIINEKGIHEPAQILEHLHSGVVKALQQHNDAETNDGMDIAICSIERSKGELHYAGANRSLWTYYGGELTETAADKAPIGGSQGRGEKRSFTGHVLKLPAGSMIYMSTDGYADQFGGQEGKKFRTKRFKNLLKELGGMTCKEQQSRLAETMKEWMGNTEQLDDILVAGIRT